ncbi:hypothetical protein FACS189473_0910 [Spirochaetia bacterium]|nr:hypothetical protein FACS189473_0910 [Spirochaetia bacterium]
MREPTGFSNKSNEALDFFTPIRYTYAMLRIPNVRSSLLLCIILAGLSIFIAAGFAQDEVPAAAPEVVEDLGDILPEPLRRPQRGESPRYPQDTVIGPLGRGSAPEAAYRLARNILTALLMNNQNAESLSGMGSIRAEEIAQLLEPVNPAKFRIGGGKVEPDGSASFLFRFIGREQSAAGELYARVTEAGTWVFDDILLEDPQDISDKVEPYPYDFTPYERFF